MSKEMVRDNFDINVFNRGAYNSEVLPEDQHYDEWILCPYTLTWDGDNYSIDTEREDLNLKLTKEEADMLTLGWGPELGGDYHEEDDFWIDANSFKDTYKNIPESVRVWLDFVTYNL